MVKKYKTIVIGLGRVGMLYGFDLKRTQPASHLSAIIKNKRLQLVAVCDNDKINQKTFLKKYGEIAKMYLEYSKLVEDINNNLIEFDIIVISTPDSTHSEILEYLIKKLKLPTKKIIIFCEKPIALNSKISKKLKMLSINSKLNIVVNHSRRWSRIWQESNKLSKQIGEIKRAAFDFSTSPENIVNSQIRDGIHIADLIGWFDIKNKTKINRLQVPYFVYDFHLWGEGGKIEVLNWGQTLNFYKIKESKRFQGFKELKLIRTKKENESMMVNTYDEFVKFLDNKKTLSTNFDDAIDAVDTFEKYVLDKKLSINNK
jgi:hypothetical protein